MKNIESLRDIIEFNNSFKTAINLYLNMNNTEKVLGYIPTKSSINFLGDYLNSVLENKEQASLLVGPYGKGKSHLLLVLLAVLSLDRTEENEEVMVELIKKVNQVDEIGNKVADQIKELWGKHKYLPVLISNSNGDLNQSFLYALNEALKREGLDDLTPETYFSIALSRIDDWKNNYAETYAIFESEITERGISIATLRADLSMCNKDALSLFKSVYPKVSAGAEFNPMAVSDVLPLYKSVSDKLVEIYNYSGLYIVFDEFSKFIESQDGSAAGTNMKLLQDICELAIDSKDSQVFFTMVAHKSIKEYGKYLSTDIINSFTGIDGRIIEKYFVTSSKNNYELVKNAIVKDENQLKQLKQYDKYLGEQAVKDYYNLPAFKSNFQLKDFENIVLKGCYPLNPVASYLLLNISEKVAQNERTLFTFISNDEPNSLARYVKEHDGCSAWVVGADLIYDYFAPLFKKDVTNEFIHNIWLSTEYALEKCSTIEQEKIVKALAIILIVNKEDEMPANDKYLSLCVDIDDFMQVISELSAKQLIYKKSSTATYVFKTRAGSELKSEIKKLREIKGDNVNYARALQEASGRYYVVPRKYNTIYQMTRFFTNQFMNADDFLQIESADVLLSDIDSDGKVITLFSFVGIKQEVVKKHVEKLADSRIVVICPKKGIKLKKQLCDYDIIQDLKNNQSFTDDNELLKKELPLLLEDLTIEIEGAIEQIYEEDSDTRVLYYDGNKVKNARAGNEETAVNLCCENVYNKTVIVNNEMVNRSSIGTSQTKKARLNIIQAILDHTDDETFYIGSGQDATIYRSVFCRTGIIDGTASDTMLEIIEVFNQFIDSCCDNKGEMTQLINKLVSAPYGLRAGLIPMYLAYVLSLRREDIIVYFANTEVQLNAEIVVNMCENADDYAIYVSKEDLEKEKYIKGLNELFDVSDNRNLSTNRIKDIFICMQRWFRALPQASRNLTCLDDYVTDELLRSAMKIITSTMKKIEFNPFEILFVSFPEAFSVDNLEQTLEVIGQCKQYFDGYFGWLQSKTSNAIYTIWGEKKRAGLYHLLKEWYDKQSDRSKQGLHDGRTTNFMSCIEGLNVYNDAEVALKVVKAVTDVYMENWNDDSYDLFLTNIELVKKEVESIRDDASKGELTLSFVGRNGKELKKLYSYVDESTGSVLRNIIEDTLEEYDDLSVNDRVSILLEMIEKILK